MIFEIDPSSKRLVANIPNGAATGHYQCEATVCGNPVCECPTLHVALFPEQGLADVAGTPKRIVSIDLAKKQIDPALQKSAPQQQLNFCNAVIEQMDQGDFNLLKRLHFYHKNVITEIELEPSQIEAQFDFDEIESGSVMLPYNNVLPFGDRIILANDGVEHMLIDHYCLRRRCDCTEVCVEFAPLTEEHSLGEGVIVANIDYHSRKWKNAEGELPLTDAKRLKEITEGSISDFYSKLTKRHAKLRSIYRHCYKRHIAALAEEPQLAAIGRNDPCPCGSGKKFKRCCMT